MIINNENIFLRYLVFANNILSEIGQLQQIYFTATRRMINEVRSPYCNSKQKLPSLESSNSPHFKIPEGSKLIGNYILGKTIGQGTFGKVHLGLHIPTGEKVAVKIIQKSKIAAKDIHRVKSQIKILSKTRHTHLIHLYEIIETEKALLLIMEYIPGGQLFRHIIKHKRLKQQEACSFFHQIISAVEYLHQNKIAHRDLKPQNILIDYDGRLKVIDFGLSSNYVENQNLKSFCGSPCYAAPQMIEGKKSYAPMPVDMWSCGVILYAMVCGSLPFSDHDTATLYKKILSGNYKFPSYLSASCKDLISNLLVISPSKRWSIAQVRNHQWFNHVAMKKQNGINFEERIKMDSMLIQKALTLGVNQSKLVEGLKKGQKNKETGSYYILMKKLFKQGITIPSYIGNPQTFDTSTIQKLQNATVSEEQSTQTVPILIQCPSIEVEVQPQPPVPLTSANPEQQWWASTGTKEQSVREVQEIINLLSKIDLVEKEHQNSKTNALAINRKKSKFYENNLTHKMAMTELSIVEKILSIPTIKYNSPSMDLSTKQKVPLYNFSQLKKLDKQKRYQSISQKSNFMNLLISPLYILPPIAKKSQTISQNNSLDYIQIKKFAVKAKIQEMNLALKKKEKSKNISMQFH